MFVRYRLLLLLNISVVGFALDDSVSSAMSPRSVLVVASNSVRIPGEKKTFGSWKTDVTHAMVFLERCGIRVTLASPNGGKIQLDDTTGPSERLRYASYDLVALEVLQSIPGQKALIESVPLRTVRAEQYDAVFVTGGIGAFHAFRNHQVLQRLLSDFYLQQKIVAATGFGVVAFFQADLFAHVPLLRGKRITGFSEEENQAFSDLLDTRKLKYDTGKELARTGASFSILPPRSAYVVEDGKLITGQQHFATDPVLNRMCTLVSSNRPNTTVSVR